MLHVSINGAPPCAYLVLWLDVAQRVLHALLDLFHFVFFLLPPPPPFSSARVSDRL